MKFFLLLLILTSQAFASVSVEEKNEAIADAAKVMEAVASETSSLKMINAQVVDELGSKLIVKFSYMENLQGTKKCSYAFDRVLKKIVKDSGICEI